MRKIIIAIILIVALTNVIYASQPKINDIQVNKTVYDKSAPSNVYKSLMYDGHYTGEVLIDTMAASCSIYNVLYASSSGWNKALANADTTIPALGMCLETGTGEKKILTRGYIRNDAWDFTKGSIIYLSTATSGEITVTKPTTSGNRLQVIGVALGSDEIYFAPSPNFIEVK